ncbi:hypothetical protein D2T31_01030 [Sinirhodobacter populi]|uniref:Uncharacterized protein n=1 Tax=Paenirhodobacter populi TaxID=2306993 RepID=A0A443KIN7_9RHOB|nr:hypothetical protein [Sinirhodobacter populi]RWR32594.1 hypothetical protein D2T31_01030 [Sinirhodobacter populi]
MQNTTLYSLFMPPEDCYGDFGLICGFTATRQVLGQIRRTFTGEMARPVLAAFIHPTVNAISDVPGLAWMWMRLTGRGYNLLHAKVALLGFRRRGGDGYVLRLAVSTGNWTPDPLTGSIDLFWSTDLDTATPDAQDVADIRAAHAMFGWLRARADCALIERRYDGHRPDALLEAAINALPVSQARPRFIDSRNQALFPQVVERLATKKKASRLILGSGYFESDGDGAAGLPERLRQALVQEKSLAKSASLDLFLNPASCQGLAARASALMKAGWNLRRPYSALHSADGRLHAKFVLLASGETEAVGRVYLGSGNLSRNGFERSASAGGNLEAGVVVDLPTGLKWPLRRNTRHSIAGVLPVQFNETATPEALQPGDSFVRPDEPEGLPPVSWLMWDNDVLSAPENKHVVVIGADGAEATTPCHWAAPAPAIVTLADGGWRLPVISADALVVPRPSDLTVEDVLAGLGSFPEPRDTDGHDDGEEGGEPLADASDAPEPPPAAYAIRRMMELLVRLGEAQARLDPRDWQRWCRELQQNLCAISAHEQAMLDFFRKAGANPLPALADPRMRPEGVAPDLLTEALSVVAMAWELSDYPSLWDREAA